MDKKEVQIARAALSGKQVNDPGNSYQCWAWVKKKSNGSMHARIFGCFGNCERRVSQAGVTLTCWMHSGREEEARALKTHLSPHDS